MIKLLMFDCDGVIFDTGEIGYKLVKKLTEKYTKKPIKNISEFRKIYESNFYDDMRKRGATKKDIRLMERYTIKELGKKNIPIHRGMKTNLPKIAKKHDLAAVSSNNDPVIKKNLKRGGLLSNFKFIYGVEEGESKIKKIKELLKKEKITRKEAIFVTDTTGDIKEAKKAGVKTMAVTWGFHPKALLMKSKPDYIVDNMREMLKVLK